MHSLLARGLLTRRDRLESFVPARFAQDNLEHKHQRYGNALASECPLFGTGVCAIFLYL